MAHVTELAHIQARLVNEQNHLWSDRKKKPVVEKLGARVLSFPFDI